MLITDHKHCTGCGSCIEACPQLAVVKIRDRYQFVYPSVQTELCVSCGRCLEVCPKDKPLDRLAAAGFERRYYAAKVKNKRLLYQSHSGGIFGLLGRQMLSEGGVVYGCVFDENRHPRHVRANDVETLDKMIGLKPVQSDTEGIFPSVKADLNNGLKVLFSGTPCQCDGLLTYMGRRHKNLLLVDVLCGGVTSEGVFHRYHYWLEQRLGGRILKLRFENKGAFGRHCGISVLFRRGRWRFLLSYPLALDMLGAMSLQGAVNRCCCGTCRYASEQRVGDISLGRFVNIRQAHPQFPRNGGASLVILSTQRGAEAWDAIGQELYCEQSDAARACANPRLHTPIQPSPYRKKLLTDIYRYGFERAAAKFHPMGWLHATALFVRSVVPDEAVMLWDKLIRSIKAWGSAAFAMLRKAISKQPQEE